VLEWKIAQLLPIPTNVTADSDTTWSSTSPIRASSSPPSGEAINRERAVQLLRPRAPGGHPARRTPQARRRI